MKAVVKFGLQIAIVVLFILPAVARAQDLGSSNGLFRSPNPKTKKNAPASEKKSAPKSEVAKRPVVRTKVAPKQSPPKTNTARAVVSKPKQQTASVVKTSTARQPVNSGKTTGGQQTVQNNIVITVGKPATGNSEELFERAIEEGNQARDERRYVDAENAYRRAQNLKPKDSRAIYGLGNIFSDQQRWEEAEKAYRQALELDPNSPEANVALSFVLTQPILGVNPSDRYAEAEKAARRAIQLDPNTAVAYDQLGVALESEGQVGVETQTAYRRAVRLDPTFALAYAHLGRLLRRIGKTEESNAAYRDAIRLSSDIPTMILVADVMQSQQRYAESEQLLRQALSGDPKNPTALFLLGRALTTSGKFDEAEKVLKMSVGVSPNSFVSYALLGSLYSRRGNFAEAERVLMQALRVVSPNEKKRLAQEFEVVGDGLMRAGRKADAARVYRQALALDKEQNELALKLAQAEKS